MDSPQSSTDHGKAPAINNTGFRPQNPGVIKVQPPRREDLQPSYAQTLQDYEGIPENLGWYGAMSIENKFSVVFSAWSLTEYQSTPWATASVSWAPFRAA